MDLQDNLIESRKHQRRKGSWKASVASILAHGALVGAIVFASATAKHSVASEDKQIRAFVSQGAAPPPPPPPPPPPKAKSAGSPKVTPKVTPVQPKPVNNAFIPPVEIPKEIPKVAPVLTPAETTEEEVVEEPSGGTVDAGVEGGVEGGVAGGVVGGVQGGIVGGEVGGVVGGEIGGVKGGVVGGVVGGTGTGTEGTGTGGNEAPVVKEPEPPPPPPEPPSGPLRVGGDVKAPIVTNRVKPDYTDTARKAKVTGVVIVECIIDKNGNVDRVKIVKDLPMGLGQEAAEAVRKWKFRPGTLNGQPIDVIFNLTVNFSLD